MIILVFAFFSIFKTGLWLGGLENSRCIHSCGALVIKPLV